MVRVRHYTRVSSMRKILAENIIRARDQNRVFVERADVRPQSPKDVEEHYLIDEGKGNAYVEFDASTDELTVRYNSKTRNTEMFLIGNVNLNDRNAIGK